MNAMKRKKTRLCLARETLKLLSAHELGQAPGAAVTENTGCCGSGGPSCPGLCSGILCPPPRQ